MFGSSDGFAWPESLQGRNTVFPVTQAALVHTNLKAFVVAGLGEWRRVGSSYLWPSQPQMQTIKDQKDSERWLHLTRTWADLAVVSWTIQWNHYVHSIHGLWVANWKFKVLERIARVICKWGASETRDLSAHRSDLPGKAWNPSPWRPRTGVLSLRLLG